MVSGNEDGERDSVYGGSDTMFKGEALKDTNSSAKPKTRKKKSYVGEKRRNARVEA